MIPTSDAFDQSLLLRLREVDPVVQRYRALFSLFDWSSLTSYQPPSSQPGPRPHPLSAYVKAFLVKIYEGKPFMTSLRTFLIEHPLLVLELGFHPVCDPTHPYGFDPGRTVPGARWFRRKLQFLPHTLFTDLLHGTVTALQAELPGLGEVVAFDVKHLYAWVKHNNPRVSMRDRFCKDKPPSADPDCKVGVKKSSNQEQADGSKKVCKEYLWGYGSGVASAFIAGYGDVVLAEYTQPFNQGDVTYLHPLYYRATLALGFFPPNITADAAFDAWHVYQHSALKGGIAAIPKNEHAHAVFSRDRDGFPFCPKGLRMTPTCMYAHQDGYRALRFRCPLLSPERTGQTCDHEQFLKAKGCVKNINIEAGGMMRVTLDRQGPHYQAIYHQRTSVERINSQAKALGIERPFVRNRRSVTNLNTLTYLLINAKALQRFRSTNTSLLWQFRFPQ